MEESNCPAHRPLKLLQGEDCIPKYTAHIISSLLLVGEIGKANIASFPLSGSSMHKEIWSSVEIISSLDNTEADVGLW